MKKPFLIAASLFATASSLSIFEAAKAGSPYDGDDAPSPQFVLNQVSAGNLVFQGIGTAQYNNSIGTNNSFQVGSSTNLGVNASTSSTPEYKVDTRARLDLAGLTTLKQVIGTSGSSQSTSAEEIASITNAHQTAETAAASAGQSAVDSMDVSTITYDATSVANAAQETWEDENSATWEDYQAANQVNTSDGGTEFDSSATYQNEEVWTNAQTASWQDTYDSSYQAAYEEQATTTRQTAETEAYNTTYNDVLTSTASAIDSVTDTTATDGTIKGSFTTKEFGSAASAATMADWGSEAATSAAASAEVGGASTWEEYYESNVVHTMGDGDQSDTIVSSAIDGSAAYQDKETWEDAYASAYSTAYNDAYSEVAIGASRTSDSQVEVKGIGSDAMVVSASTSTFDVTIESALVLGGETEAESTATASGSAGANLSTSSFANQSQATTASAFMQAFGGEALLNMNSDASDTEG